MAFVAGVLATVVVLMTWVICFIGGGVAVLACQEYNARADADEDPADEDPADDDE